MALRDCTSIIGIIGGLAAQTTLIVAEDSARGRPPKGFVHGGFTSLGRKTPDPPMWLSE
jgi:hypothetical protein